MHAELHQWLTSLLGQAPEPVEPLRPEASFRTFFRISTPDGPAVAMYAPPGREDAGRFVRLAGVMRAHGIPVPAILAEDSASGFVLMEDFGRTHLIDLYHQGRTRIALELAVDELATLQRLPVTELPPYTAQRLADELDLFTTWFAGAMLEQSVPPAWPAFAAGLVDRVDGQPRTAVHRDYHCKNLLVRDGRLGIVDFQDALAGPALYDLASLLGDCYWTHTGSDVRLGMDRYLAATPLRFTDPWIQLHLTALQRQLKAIGIFARLSLRDGKHSHLAYIGDVLQRATALARAHTGDAAIVRWLEDLGQRWPQRLQQLRQAPD